MKRKKGEGTGLIPHYQIKTYCQSVCKTKIHFYALQYTAHQEVNFHASYSASENRTCELDQ